MKSINILLFFFTMSIALTMTSWNSKVESVCEYIVIWTWHDSTHIHPKSRSFLCSGIRDSEYIEWDSAGHILVWGHYQNGKKNGNWESFKYSNKGQIIKHIYENFNNDSLLEYRSYILVNGKESIYLSYSYSYVNNDTLRVTRIFDYVTGYLTQMDSTLNGQFYGTSKSWDSQDGFLYLEIFKIDSITNCNKYYNRDGSRKITFISHKPFRQTERYYSSTGKLLREVIIDEHGKIFKKKFR
jgi:antitoxin component YwqK of YwqJK toxin-antitoxin module